MDFLYIVAALTSTMLVLRDLELLFADHCIPHLLLLVMLIT